jgi:hypothetical protein
VWMSTLTPSDLQGAVHTTAPTFVYKIQSYSISERLIPQFFLTRSPTMARKLLRITGLPTFLLFIEQVDENGDVMEVEFTVEANTNIEP